MGSDDRGLPGFSLPQWIRRRAFESYEIDDLSFSPPLDDDAFLHMKRRSGTGATTPTRRPSTAASAAPTVLASSSGSTPVVVVAPQPPATLAAPPTSPLIPQNPEQPLHILQHLEQANLIPQVPPNIKKIELPRSPVDTPQASPQPPRRTEKHAANPYFTGEAGQDRPAVGSPAWLFKGNSSSSGDSPMVRSSSEEGEQKVVPNPSQLREMNVFSPMSM